MIELGLPRLADALLSEGATIVLVSGEAPDERWRQTLERLLAAYRVRWVCEKALGYWVDSGRPRRIEVRCSWERAFEGAALEGDVVWAHNQSLGRNLPATEALVEACARRRLRLVMHHHDWWSDQRWHRWPEIREAGFLSLKAVADTLFPVKGDVRHAAINHADYQALRRRPAVTVEWMPNPAGTTPAVSKAETNAARDWLSKRYGVSGPVWLMPCRLLRRKNVAEALLLTRWLRPEATLVTTGGVSSSSEQTYAKRLSSEAKRGGWPLRLSVLQKAEASGPRVEALVSASEAILLTSLQEGFGLPYLEASAARRPLLARRLPNVSPDLEVFGFRFPQSYDEVLVPDHLFDAKAECRRQERAWRAWRAELPSALRDGAKPPGWWQEAERDEAWPFSRLSLTAQLEVLAWPPGNSWEEAVRLNPWLGAWRLRARTGGLKPSAWPRRARHWLGGEAYAAAFRRLLEERPAKVANEQARRVQERLLATHLSTANHYPLLWSPES